MSAMPRRDLYRRSKRLLVKLLLSRWEGTRRSLEKSVWQFLRGRQRQYLLRLLQSRATACSAAALILLGGVAHSEPLVLLNDVGNGEGGFVMTGTGVFGAAVSGGEDVNGDGFSDVLVGAPQAQVAAQFVGKAYVVFGKASTSPVNAANLDSQLGGGFVINGNSSTARIGSRVAMAGIINNGSNRDLVLSADTGSIGGSTPVYVVHGKSTATAVEISNVAAGTGGFLISGVTDAYQGPDVYALGDVNGDGRDDIIIGARYYNNYTGRVYVVFGKDGTTAATTTQIAAGTGGFVIEGIDLSDQAGRNISIAGDMNGDGRDEIVIGGPFAGLASGEAYVVFGKTTGTAVNLNSFTNGFKIDGGLSSEYVGRRIAGCGDINGDGRGDVLVGAPYNDSSSQGNVYVVFGKATTSTVSLDNVANGAGGFVINGRPINARAGESISGAGDVNGDGLEDIIIGSYRLGFQGQAYVVFGKSGTIPVALQDVWNGLGGFGILGTVPYDQAGITVSRAGDVNNDGLDDVIVGSPGEDRAYVVFAPAVAPVSVGLTSSESGEPIHSGVVFVERSDAPVGFRAPLAEFIGGNAIYRSQLADLGNFNVTAIASGFQPSTPVGVPNDGSVPGIQLDPDASLAEPNILTVAIRVLNQQSLPTGQRVLTKTAQLYQGGLPLPLTPVYGRGTMVFIGAPSGVVSVVIPDTPQYDFMIKTVTLATGVDQTIVVDARLKDGAAARAELPGIVIGTVLNGTSDPTVEYPDPLVIHTLNANGLSTSTFGTVDGAYVLPDVVAGAGTIQAFSNDGALEGTIKNVQVVSGQIYGDQGVEDTLLSVSPPLDDIDFDGLPDSFELTYLTTVPLSQRGPNDDPDIDGLTNIEEYTAGTHPAVFDSDSDSVPDGVELVLGADPNNASSQPGPQSEVFVDFGYLDPLKAGLLLQPYSSLTKATQVLENDGTIRIKGDVQVTVANGPDGPISKPMRIEAIGGKVTIQ